MNNIRFICLGISIFFLTGCSTEKNSFKNRSYHNITAWFNILFNGKKTLNQKLNELKTGYQDDYFTILNVEPLPEISEKIEATNDFDNDDFPQGVSMFSRNPLGKKNESKRNEINDNLPPKTGFERVEEKALKAIANHSMRIQGDEKNRLIARAYLMLGKAKYFQGKFFEAIDNLRVIEKLSFDKYKDEAKLYEALALQKTGNNTAAIEILTKLTENNLNKRLKTDVYKNLAQILFFEKEYPKAIDYLKTAIDASRNNATEARLTYILGQYYTATGDLKNANSAFLKVFKLKPGFEMEANSQIARALNFSPDTDNYLALKTELSNSLKKGTYKDFYGNLYYGLGKIELKKDSSNLAKKLFEKALKEKISDDRYKGEIFAEIANIYFSKPDYFYASAYYDSAVSVYPNSPRKETLKLAQKSLHSLKEKFYIIKKNDSIIRLVNMNDSERENFFEKFINELKKSDEKSLASKQKETSSDFSTYDDNNFSFEQKRGSKFYFYNSSTKYSGEQDFVKIWGNRALSDNWRYSNTGTKSIEEKKAELTGEASLNNPRRYDISFYTEKIPNQEKASELKIERDSLSLALGVEYFDSFKNKNLANKTLSDLLKSPIKKQNIEIETLYHLYRINIDNSSVADLYKNELIQKYPNSTFSQFILNPQKELNSTNSPEAIDIYNQIYDLYQKEDYKNVHQIYELHKNDLDTQPIFAKIELIEAFSLAKTDGLQAYKVALQKIASKYNNSPIGLRAKELIESFDQKK